jgi:hypothetical protein
MSAETLYHVRLRYMMDDAASANMRGLDDAIKDAQRSSSGLQGMLGKIGAVAAGVFGVHQAKRSLIDFNSSMEQARIQMAGLFEANMGGEIGANMARANDLVGRLQERMKAAAGTTAEAVQMASMLAQPFAAAGASLQQMEDMTVGAVVGAKAMGIAADVAARDVDQALRGQFRSTDPFTGKLLGAAGFVGEEGRARFNQMDADKRFETVNEALNSKALRDMAAEQENSFEGVLSTFEDNLQQFLGKVGLPLFKSITAEIKRWNEWIDANGERLARMGRDLSDGLMTAFSVLKDVGTFFYDNRALLMALAQAWVGVKVAGAVSGFAGSVGGLAGGALGGLGAAVKGPLGGSLAAAGATVSHWLGPAGLVVGALAGFVSQVEALRIHDRVRQAPIVEAAAKFQQGRDFINRGRQDVDLDAMNAVASQVARFAADQNLLNEERTGFRRDLVNGAWLAQAMDNMGFGSTEEAASVQNAILKLRDDVRAGIVDLRALLGEQIDAGEAANKKSKDKKGKGDAPPINIHRIEVATDDPDRFAMNLTTALTDAVANPSAAAMARTIQGG